MAKEDKDIADFAARAERFHAESEVDIAMFKMHDELMQRTTLYLEFLAGAFLKETGLRASEAELIQWFDPNENKIHWKYQKSTSVSQLPPTHPKIVGIVLNAIRLVVENESREKALAVIDAAIQDVEAMKEKQP